jgi:hypothetical protein
MSETARSRPLVGAIYFEAWCDPETGKVDIDTHVLRTIRGRYGYLVAKNEWTWEKTGHGDRATWDWVKRVDPIWRNRFRIEEGVPERYARSKSQAVRAAIRGRRRHYEQHPSECAEEDRERATEMKALERRLKFEMRGKAR